MINKNFFKNKLTNLFFNFLPRQCIVCESESESSICSYCMSCLPFIDSYCEKCGLALNNTNKNKVCIFCQDNVADFNKFITVMNYEEPIKTLIRNFKYHHNILYLKTLGELLKDKILSSYNLDNLPEVIIPIPSYAKKLKNRGYNQSIELARYLSKELKIPIDLDYLIKTKDTRSQVGLKKEERIYNVKNSFVINNPRNYKHIAIVDDVVTTFATVWSVKKTISNDINNVMIDAWCIAKQHECSDG